MTVIITPHSLLRSLSFLIPLKFSGIIYMQVNYGYKVNDKLPLWKSINSNCFSNPLVLSKVSKVELKTTNDQEMGKE